MTYLIQTQKSSQTPESLITNTTATSSGLKNDSCTSTSNKNLNLSSSNTATISFLSRFTSLKSLADENLNSPSETVTNSSGFFSKLSSLSISSSTSSLLAQNKLSICFICKKQIPAQSNNEDLSSHSGPSTALANKFKKWNLTKYSANKSRVDLTLVQCSDCLNFACERCGNTTSPDMFSLVSKSSSIDVIYSFLKKISLFILVIQLSLNHAKLKLFKNKIAKFFNYFRPRNKNLKNYFQYLKKKKERKKNKAIR